MTADVVIVRATVSPDRAKAHLGRREETERELQILFGQTQKDRQGYPRPKEAAARAYTILGDIDKALPMLARAISQPTQWCLTPAILRLEPRRDPLRRRSAI